MPQRLVLAGFGNVGQAVAELVACGHAAADGLGITGVVGPRLIDEHHPLAAVTGATNAVRFSTELLGEVTLSGPGAGRTETAYSVLNDLARISAESSR